MCSRQLRQCLPRIGDDNVGHALVDSAWVAEHDGAGAGVDRLRNKPMAVIDRAIDGYEQVLFLHAARIIRKVGNPDGVEGLGASEFDVGVPEKLKQGAACGGWGRWHWSRP